MIINTSNLIQEANKSVHNVEIQLTSWKGREVEKIPAWITKHQRVMLQLEDALKKNISSNEKEKLNKILTKCKKTNNQIITITGIKSIEYVDKHRLLSSESKQSIPQKQLEWHMHLGLLMHAFKNTNSPDLKRKIAFMIANYLAKAAPIVEESKSLDLKFQRGLFQYGDYYHRSETAFNKKFFADEVLKLMPFTPVDYMLIDTAEIDFLFPLLLTVVPTPSEVTEHTPVDAWSDILIDRIQKTIGEKKWTWEKPLEFPFLFDFTEFLKHDFDPEKLPLIEKKLNQAVIMAADQLLIRQPSVFKKEDRAKLEAYLRWNICAVYKDDIKNVGILCQLNVLRSKEFYKVYSVEPYLKVVNGPKELFPNKLRTEKDEFWEEKLKSVIWTTGVNVGFVRGREMLSEFIPLQELLSKENATLVEYTGVGPNATYFKTPEDFLNSSLLDKCKKAFKGSGYLEVMGGSTLNLLQGLIKKIDGETWQRLNEKEDSRLILQTILFKTLTHLANAHAYRGDFARFCQEIELIHYQIADLLILATPYQEQDFEKIYAERIHENIPASLRRFVEVGITKSAMNTFAGINVGVNQLNPAPERVYGEGGYYETVVFIGKNRTAQEVIQDPKVRQVDLYVGEFNHNIDVDSQRSLYRAGDVIGDVSKILALKPAEHLTVAIDCTIDYVSSKNVFELLERFSEEIKNGQLNFVFFRSGQKLDMFGMDNYYGAPFYVVNNGDPHWDGFKQLTTHPAFKSDPLTKQWFSLLNEIDPESGDRYRELIFTNARQILDQVPTVLKPGGNSQVKVCEAEPNVLSPFIDIKTLGEKGPELMEEIKELLFKTFEKHHIKYHHRASFGFNHPNINIIADPTGRKINMRINPGINSAENAAYREFFEELVHSKVFIEHL